MEKNITRRQMILGAISLCLLGCSNEGQPVEEVEVVLGPINNFTSQYHPINSYRIAILSSNENGLRLLKAISLVCSHQSCLLKKSEIQRENNAVLLSCPCHGSLFDHQGMPVTGPAKLPLVWKKIGLQNGQLVLYPLTNVSSDWSLQYKV